MKLPSFILGAILGLSLVCCHHPSEKIRSEDIGQLNDTVYANITPLPERDDSVDAISLPETEAPLRIPDEEDLKRLQNLISEKLGKLGENPLGENVWGCGVMADAVMVSMAINTPYWQNEFRKNISDSPYIRFDGPSEPKLISSLVDSVAEMTSIILRPDSLSFKVNSKYAVFSLINNSERNLEFGVDYIVGYKGQDDRWYKLPQPGFWADMGITLLPTGRYEIKTRLHPQLNRNKAGIYRLYKQVRFEDEKRNVWLMTEFRLE